MSAYTDFFFDRISALLNFQGSNRYSFPVSVVAFENFSRLRLFSFRKTFRIFATLRPQFTFPLFSAELPHYTSGLPACQQLFNNFRNKIDKNF